MKVVAVSLSFCEGLLNALHAFRGSVAAVLTVYIQASGICGDICSWGMELENAFCCDEMVCIFFFSMIFLDVIQDFRFVVMMCGGFWASSGMTFGGTVGAHSVGAGLGSRKGGVPLPLLRQPCSGKCC